MDEIEMKNLMDELYLRIFMLEEQLNEQEECYMSVLGYLLNQLRQKENIIKEVREEVKIYEEQSNDGTTNELDNYVFVQRLKNVLDKAN